KVSVSWPLAMSQILMAPSKLAEASRSAFAPPASDGRQETEYTAAVCPRSVSNSRHDTAFQIRTVPSPPADAILCPSGLHARSNTSAPPPRKSSASSHDAASQILISPLLELEAIRRPSGLHTTARTPAVC